MTEKSWKSTKLLPSPRLIPGWKILKLLINNILKDIKIEELRNNVIVLSDWPKTLHKESHHPQNKPFVCFYSINANYFVSLDWVEPYEKRMQAVLWTQEKKAEMKGIIKKIKFHMIAQVPPIKAMVHTGSYNMLIVYCGDYCLRLFGDHSQAFTSLGTVPCRFSISCLCYDSETEMLLSGTLGAVVTWLILPGGRGLQVSQTVSMPGDELVHGLSLNSPRGSFLALCENVVRVFSHQGQGQLKAVKTFTATSSGSYITCSYSCVFQSTFYAGDRAGEIHAWGLDKGNFLHSFQAHSSSVLCVYSRPETHTLFTAGSEGVLREWNLASGNLLRQLSIDEDLQHVQFIDNTTFYCQSASSFSLHHLPYFYSLFNVCGSAPQKMQRVCCGHKWTRILCATEDGLLRFLSPVTGDLLIVTWPLNIMDNTVAWAYDPDREELFVAVGSPEVLVFDATRSPCPAKYIVCTSENQSDKAKCLAYGRYSLTKTLKGLMFCGHESGIVRVLSHYSYACTEKTIHSGAVLALSTLEGLKENSLLCSYGKDNTVHLTEVVLYKNDITLQPASKILCVFPLKHVVLLPGSVGAITEDSCWCVCHYQDSLTSSAPKQMLKETTCLHECAVTSFDVCLLLKLFVTGAMDGSVRIWDFHGRLITELDSALHFGPLCFANNRGDLLLTFNQSIYIVSCLKLLPPSQLIKLDSLSNDDEIREPPKPFLPSFFFLFEMVFVPKFVYLGQKLQKLQGLEALVNKRVIAFDNAVPHVVEEERCIPSMTQERLWLNFLEGNYVDLSSHDHRHPYSAPAQLQLPGWDGLNTYRKLQSFFGQGKQWPFAPDCYIPNSVVRACLWPEGTPIFLRYDFCLPQQEKYVDMPVVLRQQPLSSVSLEDEDASSTLWKDIYQEQKRTSHGILESLTQKNWVGRKFSRRFVENLIETILNLTAYCSSEKYRAYFNALVQIFATYQISPRLHTETACRLLKDTTHYNSLIRELAWEMLEKLGFIGHLFAVPLAVGLMDSEKNVRTKVLYLMTRFTGIQTKSKLMHMLSKQETLQEMQLEMIGEASLGHLLGIEARDMQCVLAHVQQRLEENLTLSHTEAPIRFSLETAKDDELEVITEETSIPLSEFEKTMEVKKKKRHIQAKRKKLMKKVLEDARKKSKKTEPQRVALPSEDTGEQRESRASGQMDTQYVVSEPELPPSPVKSKVESQESMLEQYSEVLEVTDQHSMEGDKEAVSKQERKTRVRKLWKKLMKEGKRDEHWPEKKKKDSGDFSEVTTKEEDEEEVTQVSEPEEDMIIYEPVKGRRGLAGTPGRMHKSHTRSWRDDICYLVTSRIASSNPGMMRDLGKELIDVARTVLTDRQPSWHLFQEICPLLMATSPSSSELDKEVKTPPITRRAAKKRGMVVARKQKYKIMGKKGVRFSPKVTRKKMKFSDHQVLKKMKIKKTVQTLGKQKGELVKGKRKFIKPEEKMQKRWKLTKGKKKPTHPEEAVTQEKETLGPPPGTLSTGDQKLVLEERELTRKEEKPLEKGEKMLWEEESPTAEGWKPEWEKITEAQEDTIRPRQESLLSSGGDIEELLGEEEELDIEEEVGKGKKKPQEVRLVEEEEEEEEEDWEQSYWYGEEEEKGEEKEEEEEEEEDWEQSYWYGEEEEASEEEEEEEEKEEEEEEEEEDWEQSYWYGEEEEASEEERVQAADRESVTEQEYELAQRKKWSAGEVKGVDQQVREEEEQEKQGHKERQGQEEEGKAMEKKHLVQERKKVDLKENEEVRRAWRRASKAQGEERHADEKVEKSEGERPEFWEEKKVDLRDEALAEKMRKRPRPEEAAPQKKAKEKRHIIGAMQLAEKVEQYFKKIKLQPRLKMKVVTKEKIEKTLPPKEKQDMKKEKQVKKGEEFIVKGKKVAKQEEEWTTKIEKADPQKKKVAQEERLQREKEERQLQEAEEEIEQKRAWEEEKLSLLKKEEQADEMENQFQRKEAREKRHLAMKQSAKARKAMMQKRQKERTQEEEEEGGEEEEEMVMKVDTSSQKDRKLARGTRPMESHVTKRREKARVERAQALRKLSQEEGTGSEEKRVSSKNKMETKEKQLLRVLAETMKEMSSVPLGQTEIMAEEEASFMGRSLTDSHRQEFFKEQAQKERELEDDRLAPRARTPAEEGSLEEEHRPEGIQETVLLDKIQVKTMLKKIQKQKLLKKSQLAELWKRRKKESEKGKIQLKWLLENVREKLFEGGAKEKEEDSPSRLEGVGLAKKRKEEEESAGEGEKGGVVPKKEKRKHLTLKKRKVRLSEEQLEKNFAREQRKKSSKWLRKERLSKIEGPDGEEAHLIEEEGGRLSVKKEDREEEKEKEKESASVEDESLSKERLSEGWSESEEERLSEEWSVSEEERLSEEWSESEEESPSEEWSVSEEESPSEEWSVSEEESPSEEWSVSEEESPSGEWSVSEEESPSGEWSVSEEESLSEEEKRKKEEKKQEEEGKLGSRLTEVMLSEEEKVLKPAVGLSRPMTEGEGLADEREGASRRKMLLRQDHLLDGKTDSRFMDKSPFKMPLQLTLGKTGETLLRVSEHHLDVKARPGSKDHGVLPMISSQKMILEKAREVFSQAMGTSLETKIPEDLQRSRLQLPHIIIKPPKPKSRPKADRRTWLFQYRDIPKAHPPTPASPPEKPAERFQKLADAEASISDEDWINDALKRVEAGEQLSRDRLRRLSQVLRNLASGRYWKQIHLCKLKTIVQRIGQNLDLSRTDISQPCEDILSPVHLKVIPPITRKRDTRLDSLYVPEPMLESATKTRTPEALGWRLLAGSSREKQAQQLPTAIKETKNLCPTRADVPTAAHYFVDKNSLALMFQKDFSALRGRVELPIFSKAKKKTAPIPIPESPLIPPESTDLKAISWHLLGEPYRNARVQQLSNALDEMETEHFYPVKRDILTGLHASVDRQTLALMFQKDLTAFKGKGRYPKLPKLEKTAQPILKRKNEVPPWETFVALYHVLRMLQQRYAKDTAAWMEQFHRLMDLYQLKSPQIQRLLQDLLLREKPPPHEVICKEAVKAMELVPGQRLFYSLICGRSHAPDRSLKFQDVLPLAGQNKVNTVRPVGIARYGFLELAWKSLPQVNPYFINNLPSISPHTL